MAKLPDGLIFEFELDHKGINLTCTQRELVKCGHCKHLSERGTYIKNYDEYTEYHLCNLTRCNVTYDHFCAEGKRISD